MTRLRNLPPATAWGEAERRSIPLAIFGFFAGGLTGTLVNRLFERNAPFVWGLCAAMITFVFSLSLMLGYYKKRWIPYILFAIASMTVLCIEEYSGFRLLGNVSTKTKIFLICLSGLLFYFALEWLHVRICSGNINSYLAEVGREENWRPKTRLGKTILWTCAIIGTLEILTMISKR